MMKKCLVVFILMFPMAYLSSCIYSGYKLNPASHVPVITSISTITPNKTEYPLAATNSAAWEAFRISVNATVAAKKVSCPELFKIEQPESVIDNSNKQWTVFTCSRARANSNAEKMAYLFDTKIAKTDMSQVWSISHDDPVWSNSQSVPLVVYKWARDGKSVYLVPNRIDGGGSYPGYFVNGNALYRLNLTTGHFESILPSIDKDYAFLLSPDDQYLAYTKPNENKVVTIRNLKSNAEKLLEINGDYVLTGAFVWTLDSTKLIFASAMNGWDEGTSGITIFILSMKDMNIKTILFNDKRLLIPFTEPRRPYQQQIDKFDYWADNYLLNVRSLNEKSEAYFTELTLDVRTGDIMFKAIPTPILAVSSTPQP